MAPATSRGLHTLIAIAQAMDFEKGEDVQWTVADKGHLILSRDVVPPNPIDLKKTLPSSHKSKS